MQVCPPPIICGGTSEAEIRAEDIALITSLTASINAKNGSNYEFFNIVKVGHQVVAGTNHFYHLNGNPGNVPITVTIFEPLGHSNMGPYVEEVSLGHNSLSKGHGKWSIR